MPKLEPPIPRGGHAKSAAGRLSATYASTPSAAPTAAKSETQPDPAPDNPFDKHRVLLAVSYIPALTLRF